MTPEEASKQFVASEYRRMLEHTQYLDLGVRLHEEPDHMVLLARIEKPEGRSFVLRLTCDDYPREPPLLEFIDPGSWDVDAVTATARWEFWPVGEKVDDLGKDHPVICLRGHREFYEGGKHVGWTNPPCEEDSLLQLVSHVRNAIFELWS